MSIEIAVSPPASVPAAWDLEWSGPLLEEPDWFFWGGCALQGPDGRFHLFGDRVASSRIAASRDLKPWGGTICWGHYSCAEIAHWVADRPEGPYLFADVALPPGREGDFDQSRIYPTVERDAARSRLWYPVPFIEGDARALYAHTCAR